MAGTYADCDHPRPGLQKRKDESAVNARIARIENGLLPAVVIKGQQPQKMKIGERMKAIKSERRWARYDERGGSVTLPAISS